MCVSHETMTSLSSWFDMSGATPDPRAWMRRTSAVEVMSVVLRNMVVNLRTMRNLWYGTTHGASLPPDRSRRRGRRPSRQLPGRHDAVGDRPPPRVEPGHHAPDAGQPAARRVDRPAPDPQDLSARPGARDGRPDRSGRILGHRRVPPGARRPPAGAAA